MQTDGAGVSWAWSPRELVPLGQTLSTTIDLEGHTLDRPNQVEITIRNTGILDIRALVDYVQSGPEPDYMSNPKIEPLMKWLNAVYRKDPSERFFTRPRGSAFFDRNGSTTMGLQSTAGMLEAIRGIYQTVQIRFGRLGLCCDTATNAFWTPGKALIEIISALNGVTRAHDLERYYSDNRAHFYESCQRLSGILVNVKHLDPRRNARKIKLLRISAENAENSTFLEKDHSSGDERRTSVSA